jgi:hypothetical protein
MNKTKTKTDVHSGRLALYGLHPCLKYYMRDYRIGGSSGSHSMLSILLSFQTFTILLTEFILLRHQTFKSHL